MRDSVTNPLGGHCIFRRCTTSGPKWTTTATAFNGGGVGGDWTDVMHVSVA